MKRVIGAVAAAMCLMFVMSSFAAAADIKIGYVDFGRIQAESKAGKQATESIMTMFKDKQAQLDKRSKEIEDALADLENRSSMLSDAARREKSEKLEKDYRDLQRFKSDSDVELEKKKAELAGQMVQEVTEIINKFGKEEGYTLILERSVVLYAPEAVDVTDKIIAAYDKSKG